MRRNSKLRWLVGPVVALSLLATACSDDDSASTAPADDVDVAESPDVDADDAVDTDDQGMIEERDPATICEPNALVEAVESGPDEGTLAGMTDDPVATAASSNPVLTTLVTAVTEAGLVDTLNSAEELTVFAPTDCAFAALDPATLDAALADPTGLLTQLLGFHVVAGQRLSSADLASQSELETFTGTTLPVAAEGDAITVGGGQATVVVPDIQTANATVHLIDSVMLPPGG
jgi:transforming growth factor-beta-induced protein